MKKILTLLFCLTVALAVNAAKAVRRPVLAKLVDGRTITIGLYGDENYHFFATPEGQVVLREGNEWRLASYEEQKSTITSYRKAMMRAGEAISSAVRPFPCVGSPKALVIMVNFTDKQFTYTRDDISNRLNSSDYKSASYTSYSSAAQYYYDCSGGLFRPQYDVVGPFDLSGNIKYYGAGDDYMDRLIPEACKLAESAGVNFSPYDNDNDGYIDLVCVLFAGYGENWDVSGEHTELIWPKSGFSYGTYGGKQLNRYLVAQELFGYEGIAEGLGLSKNPEDGVGLFCHEMCHTLGLPDLYANSYLSGSDYDNQSMERWDLMDGGEYGNNGFYPTPLTAWECNLLGWKDYVHFDTLKVAGDYQLELIPKGHKAYIIQNDQDATGNEYYVLENIQKGKDNGWYRYMPGHGMLITHVNYNRTAFGNFSMPNNTKRSPRITVLPANGYMYGELNQSVDLDTIKGNWKGNPFPGISGVTSFNYKIEGYPNAICYNGTPDVMAETKSLTNIKEENGIISFTFGNKEKEVVLGDANGDGVVSVADVSLMASYILGDVSVAIDLKAADYNKDGEVTVSDLSAVAALILSN